MALFSSAEIQVVNWSLLSHLSPLSPCWRYRVVQRPCHRSLPVAHTSLMFQAFRSLLTVSFHRNLSLPLGHLPSIFNSTTALMFSVSSLLFTCPNHSSLLLTIGSTLASSKISSFLPILTTSVFPPQLRSSSRVLPLHIQLHNCSDVFSFISSFHMPEPFQPSQSHSHRFHLCFLQDLLISPMF